MYSIRKITLAKIINHMYVLEKRHCMWIAGMKMKTANIKSSPAVEFT